MPMSREDVEPLERALPFLVARLSGGDAMLTPMAAIRRKRIRGAETGQPLPALTIGSNARQRRRLVQTRRQLDAAFLDGWSIQGDAADFWLTRSMNWPATS